MCEACGVNLLGRNGRWAVEQGQPLFVRVHASAWVNAVDIMECFQEVAAEIADAGVALPELVVEGGPGDELRPVCCYAVHPLGQPGVDVKSKRGMGDAADGAVVEWHGMAA